MPGGLRCRMQKTRTVEKGIISYEDAAADDDQACDATESALGRATSASSESRGPSCELRLESSPGFLGVRGRHFGKEV